MNMISCKLFRLYVPIAIVLVSSLASLPCRAQDSSAPAPAPPVATEQQPNQVGPTIKKESRLVLVDTVVTDKKGNYLHDLSKNDFRVFEDNKEQSIVSFSSGADTATPQNPQKHYLVLFFDNSSMALPDQISARAAAPRFIESNAAPDHLMAVVDFTGSIRIVQNFTANTQFLQPAAN